MPCQLCNDIQSYRWLETSGYPRIQMHGIYFTTQWTDAPPAFIDLLLNSLAPRKYGGKLKIFKFNIQDGSLTTPYGIALRWMPKSLINEKSNLVQIVAGLVPSGRWSLGWSSNFNSHFTVNVKKMGQGFSSVGNDASRVSLEITGERFTWNHTLIIAAKPLQSEISMVFRIW